MNTSLIFMLAVQGTVTIITAILYYKILTAGKKKEKEEEEEIEKVGKSSER